MCLVSFPAASMIFKSPEANALSDAQYGFAFLAQIGLAILASFQVAKLLTHLSEKTLFLTGLLCNLGCLLFLWLTLHTHGNPDATFWLLLIANGFLGAGFGLTISTMNLYVVELHPHHKDAAVTGLHGILGIGAAITPLSVNFFHEQGDWTRSLLIAATLGFVLFFLTYFGSLLSNQKHKVAGEIGAVKKKLAFAIYLFLGLLVVYGTIESILGNWTITFIDRDKGLSAHAASVSLSLFWIFLTVGRLLTSFLSMKIKSEKIYVTAPFVVLLSLAAAAVASSEGAVWISFVFIGLGCSSVFPLTLSLSIARFPEHKEALSGLTLTALMMGVGIGSSGVGALQSITGVPLGQVFFGCAVAAFFLLPLFLYLVKIPPVLKDA